MVQEFAPRCQTLESTGPPGQGPGPVRIPRSIAQPDVASAHVDRTLPDHLRGHGFEPIDTPALEHLEVLTGKAGENEKLMYHFLDHGDRPVGMRYDLTVPLGPIRGQSSERTATFRSSATTSLRSGGQRRRSVADSASSGSAMRISSARIRPGRRGSDLDGRRNSGQRRAAAIHDQHQPPQAAGRPSASRLAYPLTWRRLSTARSTSCTRLELTGSRAELIEAGVEHWRGIAAARHDHDQRSTMRQCSRSLRPTVAGDPEATAAVDNLDVAVRHARRRSRPGRAASGWI